MEEFGTFFASNCSLRPILSWTTAKNRVQKELHRKKCDQKVFSLLVSHVRRLSQVRQITLRKFIFFGFFVTHNVNLHIWTNYCTNVLKICIFTLATHHWSQCRIDLVFVMSWQRIQVPVEAFFVWTVAIEEMNFLLSGTYVRMISRNGLEWAVNTIEIQWNSYDMIFLAAVVPHFLHPIITSSTCKCVCPHASFVGLKLLRVFFK